MVRNQLSVHNPFRIFWGAGVFKHWQSDTRGPKPAAF
jgi:hypothetical protein